MDGYIARKTVMTRKPPKRAGESHQPSLTIMRLVELAEVVSDSTYVIGPQDQADLIESLRELVERRHTEEIVRALTVDEREVA